MTKSRSAIVAYNSRIAVQERATNDEPSDDHGRHCPQIAALLESYYKVLLGLALRRTGNQQLTGDLVNDAVVVVLEQVHAGKLVDLDQRLLGYIWGVCLNLLRNHRRYHVNRSDLRAHPRELEACVAPEDRDPADEECTSRRVRELLASLSTRNRELIHRFYLHEEDRDSLCRSMGISLPQLYLRISRAKQQMRATFIAKGWNRQDLL